MRCASYFLTSGSRPQYLIYTNFIYKNQGNDLHINNFIIKLQTKNQASNYRSMRKLPPPVADCDNILELQ